MSPEVGAESDKRGLIGGTMSIRPPADGADGRLAFDAYALPTRREVELELARENDERFDTGGGAMVEQIYDCSDVDFVYTITKTGITENTTITTICTFTGSLLTGLEP